MRLDALQGALTSTIKSACEMASGPSSTKVPSVSWLRPRLFIDIFSLKILFQFQGISSNLDDCWNWIQKVSELSILHLRNASDFHKFNYEAADINDSICKLLEFCRSHTDSIEYSPKERKTAKLNTLLSVSSSYCRIIFSFYSFIYLMKAPIWGQNMTSKVKNKHKCDCDTRWEKYERCGLWRITDKR